MIYKAHTSFTQLLLALSETGMGYQIIDAKRRGKSFNTRFIVYNSELIVDLDTDFYIYKLQIIIESYNIVYNKSEYIDLESPSLVNRSIMNNTRTLTESNMTNKGRHSGGTGAIDNSPIFASGTDNFVRLSAYSDDKRIDFINKRLKNGSYTTTEIDYLTCKKYSDDPIDRYSLPSNDTIKWAFYIKPSSIDKFRPGIVQPANNHDGGGIEALFDNGTSNGTYFERKPY